MFTAEAFSKALKYKSLFAEGVVCTIALSAVTVLLGFIIALVLALMRMSSIYPFKFLAVDKHGLLRDQGFLFRLSRFNPLSLLATVYVEIFRATPVIVQIMLIYHVAFANVPLPNIKLFGFIRFNRFFPGALALSLNSGAYLCEIIRSGIQSIDGGQTEAARSLGMSQLKNMRYIILPQAIKNILPAIANEFVTIIKESAICYTIGVQDIMAAAQSVIGATYSPGAALIIATAIYFCLCFPTSKIIAAFERKMSAGDRRSGTVKRPRGPRHYGAPAVLIKGGTEEQDG